MTKLIELLYPFDELREIVTGDPAIADNGIVSINKLLHRKGHPSLPEGFIRDEVTASGKFAVRVARWLKAYHGAKVPPSLKTEIGNIANQNILKGDRMLYDLTYEIMTWPRGSFGNYTSCYRNSREGSIPMIEEGNGYGPGFCMRLFKPGGKWYGKYKGWGRVWIIPCSGNTLAVFNGYGIDTRRFGGLLVKVFKEKGLEVTYRGVTLRNGSGQFHINGDGVLIGRDKDVGTRDRISFDMKAWTVKVCNACNDKIRIPVRDAEKYVHGFDGGSWICENCGRTCAICNQWGVEVNGIYAPGAVIQVDDIRASNESVPSKHRSKKEIRLDENDWIHDTHVERGYLRECKLCDQYLGKTQSCSH